MVGTVYEREYEREPVFGISPDVPLKRYSKPGLMRSTETVGIFVESQVILTVFPFLQSSPPFGEVTVIEGVVVEVSVDSEEEVVWVGGGAVTLPSVAVGRRGGAATVTVADFDTCVLFNPVQVRVKTVVVARGRVS